MAFASTLAPLFLVGVVLQIQALWPYVFASSAFHLWFLSRLGIHDACALRGCAAA